MDDSAFQPELLKGEWSRKQKLSQYTALSNQGDITNIGYKKFGHAKIDCRFVFAEAKRGVLQFRGRTSPAGIIRMDISFNQTEGYKLKWATIQVTLDGEHKDLKMYREKEVVEKDLVCMTNWYGPNEITGKPIAVSEKKTTHATPEISLPQGGISGLGYDSEKSFDHNFQWKFTGDLEPGQGKGFESGAYDTLKWHLKENELETDSSHPNLFQTAFAFVNGGQPFLMKVEIQGRLKKIRHELKEKARALKFGSSRHKEENISTTLVRGFTGRTQPLDLFVKNLNKEMKEKNGDDSYSGPVVVESAATKLSVEESELEQKALNETPPAYSEREVEGVDLSAQQWRDMVMSLISSADRPRHPSAEKGTDSTTATDEKRESTKQMEVDSRTAKVVLKIFLLQMLMGCCWFIAYLFTRKDR